MRGSHLMSRQPCYCFLATPITMQLSFNIFALYLTYSQKFENRADRWISRCQFEHLDTRVWMEYAGTGQNHAITGGRQMKLKAMMKIWREEAKDYSCDGDCMYNNDCGHCIQVIFNIRHKITSAFKLVDFHNSTY